MSFERDLARSLGVDKLSGVAAAPSGTQHNVGNDASLEEAWAIKASEHADVYFNLISSVDTDQLRISPNDDELYTEFRSQFPHLPVHCLTTDSLKSDNAKTMWRPFCEQFKDTVESYNYGTLLRLDATDEYSNDNTILVPRVQFLAIEVARNREGHNRLVRDRFTARTQRIKEAPATLPVSC